MRDNAKITGEIVMYDRSESGRKVSLRVGSAGAQGGISSDPAIRFSYLVRRALRPRCIAPVVIMDAAGKPVAQVTFDANGVPTRIPLGG